LIQKKEDTLPGSNDEAKLSADIRRKFQKEERDLLLLKNSLKKIKDITSKERARRKDNVERLISQKSQIYDLFNQGKSVKK
jgi:hypothetical protein